MPTTRIRRFVDVVFVEPKHKQYVILHQGEFWQLPRMHLTQSSWELRTPYTGSLNDIFVAQNQGISCQELEATLTTYELPEQLAGLSATHFLGWWSNNDYKWLSQNNVVHLTDDTNSTPPNKSPKKHKKAQKSTTKAQATPKTPAENPTTANLPPQTPKHNPSTQRAAQTNTNPQTTPPKTAKNTPNSVDNIGNDLDIFDNLLHELNEEMLNPSR